MPDSMATVNDTVANPLANIVPFATDHLLFKPLRVIKKYRPTVGAGLY